MRRAMMRFDLVGLGEMMCLPETSRLVGVEQSDEPERSFMLIIEDEQFPEADTPTPTNATWNLNSDRISLIVEDVGREVLRERIEFKGYQLLQESK